MTIRKVGLDVPFVGRDDELTTVLNYASARDAVLIAGGPGSGKTRLVQEVAGIDDAPLLLVGRCSDQTRTAPYGPFREIARQAARLLDPNAMPWADGARDALIALFPKSTQDPSRLSNEQASTDEYTRRHTLWLSWVEYCDELAAITNRPIALVLEDAQWADQESLALFAWLCGQPLDLGLVATTRPQVPDRLAHLPTIALSALSVAAVARMLTEIGDSPDGAARLHSETDGHPLRLRRWCTQRALSGDSQPATSDEDPLANMQAETRAILQVAALMQGEVDTAFLATLAHCDELEVAARLDPAVTADLVASDGAGRYWFTHDSYRDQVDSAIGTAERAGLHRQIVTELEARHGSDPDMLALLAHHATKASIDGGRTIAIDYLTRAGAHARRTLAPESARELLSLAVELAQMDGDAAVILRTRLELGLALVASSDPTAEAVLEQVYGEAKRLDDAETYTRAALAQPSSMGAVGVNFLGDPTAARRLREAASMLVDEHPLLAPVYAQLALQQHATLSEADFFSYVERAETVAAAHGDADLELTTFLARHGIRRPVNTLGPLRQAVTERLEAVSGAHPAFVPLTDIAVVAALRDGDLATADRLLSRLEHELEPMHPVAQWTALRNRAALAHARGSIDQFETLALEAMGQAAGTRYASAATMYFGFQVATAMRERQMHDDADVALDAWIAESPSYPAFRAARAWLRADQGDMSGCRSDLAYVFAQDLDEYVSRVEGLLLVAMATAGAWAVGDTTWCARAHDLMAPYRDEWIIIGGGTVIDGPTLRPLALASSILGEHDRALQEIDAAVAATVRAGAHLTEITCKRDRAYVLRAAGRLDEAVEAFRATAGDYRGLNLDTFATILEGQAAELETMQAGATVAAPAPTAPAEVTASLRLEGQAWVVQFGDESGAVADLKGMRMLRILIERPQIPIRADVLSHIAEHGSAADGGAETNGYTTGAPQEVIDDQARAAYRERVSQIGREIERADRRGDVAGSQILHAELEAITVQLHGSSGLGSRPRAMADDAERARIRVRKSIRSAITRIRSVAPSLGDHLDRNINTGTSCSYAPDPRTAPEWAMLDTPSLA